MLQPNELKLNLPVQLSNGVVSTTTKLWQVLVAAKNGDTDTIKELAAECPAIIYGQYNYTPPIYFAAREGHLELVKYLLQQGAHDPAYKNYPFGDTLQTLAQDSGFYEIVTLLHDYAANQSPHRFEGDNGQILYNRTEEQLEFEKAVDEADLQKTALILKQHPEFAKDETYFWSEGILAFAAKENNRPMIDLLMSYGATVPSLLKWAQFYYLEHDDGAAYILDKGMNSNTTNWHQVSLLHDMAQKGNIYKAGLLLKYGANIDAVDEEYLRIVRE
ncbi:MAG: ankyrin repeat domain-containing protein [Sphingobacteriales bacterium]|nr:MAG: ankyrin repeat domain-containing protein [Sphingobacteriales bacterium]